MIDKQSNYQLPAILFILLSQVLLFVPLTIYFWNIEEFSTTPFALFRLIIIPLILGFVLLFALFQKAGDKFRSLISANLACVSILFWVQVNLFSGVHNPLDGNTIEWETGLWRSYLDSFVWGIALIGVNTFYQKLSGVAVRLASILFIVQFFSLVYLAADKLSSYDAPRENKLADFEQVSAFSKDTNIVHILIDGFQSDIFKDSIENEMLSDFVRGTFSGFTFYEETFGVFPFTKFAVPVILGGKYYSNDVPKEEFIDNVLRSENILNTAVDNGYELDVIAGGAYLAKKYRNTNYQYFYEISTRDNISEAVKIVDLALFRLVPYKLKPHIYLKQKWLLSSFLLEDKPIGDYFSHTAFMNRFIDAVKVNRDKAVYKFIHLMNTHNPMVVNNTCNYAGGELSTNRENLTYQSFCTLITLSEFFKSMKAQGIFDEALIIIHSDHGGWVGNKRQGPPIIFNDGKMARPFVASLASPLLMVKLPNSEEELQVSRAHVSLADLADTISDINDWGRNFGHESLLDVEESDVRERYFRFYLWKSDTKDSDYIGPVEEFKVNGSHYESEWERSSVFYPPE